MRTISPQTRFSVVRTRKSKASGEERDERYRGGYHLDRQKYVG